MAKLESWRGGGNRTVGERSFLLAWRCVGGELACDVVGLCGAGANVEDCRYYGRVRSHGHGINNGMRVGQVACAVWAGLDRVGSDLTKAVVGIALRDCLVSGLQHCWPDQAAVGEECKQDCFEGSHLLSHDSCHESGMVGFAAKGYLRKLDFFYISSQSYP